MEAYNYPFYGTQFHPEKYQFSFHPDSNFLHTNTSIVYNRYFADFFIEQARKNNNQFPSYEVETNEICENFDTIVTTTYYGTVYVFKKEQ